MSAPAVQTLFITLKRGLAGVRHQHVRIVESLGFKYRQQTIERRNTPQIRGAIAKVLRDRVGDRQALVGECLSVSRPCLSGRHVSPPSPLFLPFNLSRSRTC